MLSVVRLTGPEDVGSSYQPVWILCGCLGLATFLTACTLSGKDVATPRVSDTAGASGDNQEAETHSLLGDEGDGKDEVTSA